MSNLGTISSCCIDFFAAVLHRMIISRGLQLLAKKLYSSLMVNLFSSSSDNWNLCRNSKERTEGCAPKNGGTIKPIWPSEKPRRTRAAAYLAINKASPKL